MATETERINLLNGMAIEDKPASLVVEYRSHHFEIQRVNGRFIIVNRHQAADTASFYKVFNYLAYIVDHSNTAYNGTFLDFSNYPPEVALSDFRELNIYNVGENGFGTEVHSRIEVYNTNGSNIIVDSKNSGYLDPPNDTKISIYGNSHTTVINSSGIYESNYQTNNTYDIRSIETLSGIDQYGNNIFRPDIGNIVIKDFRGSDTIILDAEIFNNIKFTIDNGDMIISSNNIPGTYLSKYFFGSIKIENVTSSPDFQIESILSRGGGISNASIYPSDPSTMSGNLPGGIDNLLPPISIPHLAIEYEIQHHLYGNGRPLLLDFTSVDATQEVSSWFYQTFSTVSTNGRYLRQTFYDAYNQSLFGVGSRNIDTSFVGFTVDFFSSLTSGNIYATDAALALGRVRYNLYDAHWTVDRITNTVSLIGTLSPFALKQRDDNLIVWDTFDFNPEDPGARASLGETEVYLYSQLPYRRDYDILTLKNSSKQFIGVFQLDDLIQKSQTFSNDDFNNPHLLIQNIGDTIYTVEDLSDPVIELPNQGTDTVQSSIDYVLPDNVEDLILIRNQSISGYGNSLNNILMGNEGNNLLDGKTGSDTLIGREGDDTYYVDSKFDVIIEKSNEGYDIVYTNVTYTFLQDTNIESVRLYGNAQIDVTGSNSDNEIIGNDSSNILNGGEGNDILNGGLGLNTLIGGLGNDKYIINISTDQIIESVNEGIDTVESTISYLLDSNVETLTLIGNDNINGTGTYENNQITGNSANNVLSGQAGNDTLNGGLGQDTLIGGQGDDLFIIDNSGDTIVENLTEGIDTVQSSIDYTLGNNLENLTLTGTSTLNGTGNHFSNVLTGNSASNILDGGDDNDTLSGNAGNDSLIGGAGNDTYIGFGNTSGADTISDSSGSSDTLNFSGYETTDVNWSETDSNSDGNVDRLTIHLGSGHSVAIENYFDDTAATSSQSGAGSGLIEQLIFDNDSNFTYTDVQTFLSSTGQFLTGTSGNNLLKGGTRNDTLDGGDGIDTLVGGVGNDTYIIDTITDTITENSNEGNDTVQASVSYTLGNNLEAVVLTGTSSINATGNALNNTLTGNAGNNILDGGTGNDTLIGGLGNDSYYLDINSDSVVEFANEGTDTVYASLTMTLAANVENYFMTGSGSLTGAGNSLDNYLKGNSGSNYLGGGAGNDTLEGANGTDTLVGGLGNDTFIVDTTTDTITENADAGIDTVVSSVSFTLGSNVENITLSGTGNINATGNALDNVLSGNAGINTLSGGQGNDNYIIDSTSDAITENSNEGIDTVQASVTYTLSANVENLTLNGTASINATGNSGHNILAGNASANILNGGNGNDTLFASDGDDTLNGEAGDDSISGGTGNDRLNGSVGNDILQGDSGSDTYVGFNNTSGTDIIIDSAGVSDSASFTGFYTANAVWSSIDSNSDGKVDRLKIDFGNNHSVSIENYFDNTASTVDQSSSGSGLIEQLIFENDNNLTFAEVQSILLTPWNQHIVGDSGNNVLTGGVDNDTIDGALGNDTLNGGAGDDSLIGGAGNDTFIVDSTNDIITENANEGVDTIQSSVTYALGNHIENLSLTGTGNIEGTGNELNNIIIGNEGANLLDGSIGNDTLNGGTGNDTLNGGIGADQLSGGQGNDTYIIDTIADTITENSNEGNDTVQASVSYTLGNNLEAVVLTGTSSINATGNALNNTLTGNAGNNILDGGTGNDTLIGGLGNDSYYLDINSDSVVEFANEGTDTVYASLTMTLAANVENYFMTGSGSLTGAGNSLDNYLKGNSGSNYLGGGAGNDTLEGANGTDTLVGGLGNDTFIVDTTTDTITENADAGIDTVVSSVSFTLGSNVENITLSGTGNINATGNALDNVLSGNAGINTLSGGQGNDNYLFFLGNGQDTVSDSAGTEEVLFDNSISKNNVVFYLTSAGNLQIGYTNSSSDLVTILGQNNSSTAVERFELSNGQYMTDADINQVISDMAAYASANNVSFTSLNDVKNDTNLIAIVNAGWHN
jgi:Ca2+-binding RTX toxin-like protein